MDEENQQNLTDRLMEDHDIIGDNVNKVLNYDLSSSSESGSDSSLEPGTYRIDPWDWLFINKSGNEEETMLYRVEALENSYFKRFFLFPFLTIITFGMTIPIIYWYPSVKAFLLFNRWIEVRTRSTHMLITGYKDYKEIVPVYMRSPENNPNTVPVPFEEEKRVPCKSSSH